MAGRISPVYLRKTVLFLEGFGINVRPWTKVFWGLAQQNCKFLQIENPKIFIRENHNLGVCLAKSLYAESSDTLFRKPLPSLSSIGIGEVVHAQS